MHDNTLTTDNRDKFIYLAGQYNQLVKFYNVEELCADKLEEFWKRIPSIKTAWSTIGSFFRLLIPQILSSDIDKCIYLDSDLIVNLDIRELWIDLGDKTLAAVPECEANAYAHEAFEAARKYLLNENLVGYKDYFNAGVLIMNLDYLRAHEELMMDGVRWYSEHPQCNCFDQDILNYLFADNYIKLPVKFDRFVANERIQGRAKRAEQAIYHYSGDSLKLDMDDPLNRLYLNYFSKTPWFGAETVEHLYERFNQIHVGLKNSMIQISAAMSGKTRAFFTTPANLDATKKIFLVRDDEEIILAENQASLQKLIDAMKKSRGKKIFFILLPNFPFRALTDSGFVFGRDFLNGYDFLSAAHGLPLNSYQLIKAM